MKKILLSLGVMAVIGTASFAQDANVGLKIGMMQTEWYGSDISSINEDGDGQKLWMGKGTDQVKFFDDWAAGKLEKGDEYSAIAIDQIPGKRWGFHAGFQINSEINDYFWLKHEFLFSTKGFSYTGTRYTAEVTEINTITDSSTTPVTSISMPTIEYDEQDNVELIYRSYNVDIMPVSLAGHYEGLQLFVGPFVSVMLGSAWVDKTNGIVTAPGVNDFWYKEDPDDIIGPKDSGANLTYAEAQRTLGIIDYGFVAGFEYELPFGLNAGIRYVQGFASAFETPEGRQRANVFNKDLRMSLGFTFGKEKD